ncbi:sigma-70 family RNA polymerase sigma factor [Rosistilla oblonga]|uniref:ECF RNA polymerase sigma-E factor n=1 Tax=Rosistilla oblonga TaxID=2527990 RepID=A0A518IPA7_9BACT|nr:sigma-70 family RNA polymerase sigma factor [Rosistilla oblonga]QDV54902.1 ECF RNA polymerase sigma-E factor [Rosistilla oblonga]
MNESEDVDRLQQYAPYLTALARAQLSPRYRAKVGVSDIVQQSMIQAYQAIDDFRGTTDVELRAWLRQILARNLIHVDRDLHRDKRNIDRERSLEDRLGQSSLCLEKLLAGSDPTPSQNIATSERVVQLAAALETLPEAQREAVRMHYLEGKKLSEVAGLLDRSTGAVAGLLHRGLKALREGMRE